jgi:hypothetical protein
MPNSLRVCFFSSGEVGGQFFRLIAFLDADRSESAARFEGFCFSIPLQHVSVPELVPRYLMPEKLPHQLGQAAFLQFPDPLEFDPQGCFEPKRELLVELFRARPHVLAPK